MSDKPRVSYADLAWAAAFERIDEHQTLFAHGIGYLVTWKHRDPDWLELTHRAGKKLAKRIVRKGDPLLLELKCL